MKLDSLVVDVNKIDKAISTQKETIYRSIRTAAGQYIFIMFQFI